jgi:Beta-L-arabinofuranosidase, GH127
LPNVQVNGLTTEIQKTDRGFAVLNRSWKSGDRVELRLPAEVRMIERPKRAVSLALGPIVLVLSPGEVWERISGSEHFGDWEVRPRHSWNYGLLVGPSTTWSSGHIERMPVTSPRFFSWAKAGVAAS